MSQFVSAVFRPLVYSSVFLGSLASVWAGDAAPARSGKEVAPPFSPFDRGVREVQLGVTGFFGLSDGSATHPHLDDIDANLRFGWMLYTPSGSSWARGNVEFLAEIFGGGIVAGPGTDLAGITLLLRYNFVQPEARLVPYFQIGAGGAYSDAHEEQPQRLIGAAFAFNLQSSLGVRLFVNERNSIYLEGDFRHLSNANLANRNTGLNSVGGQLGYSWSF